MKIRPWIFCALALLLAACSQAAPDVEEPTETPCVESAPCLVPADTADPMGAGLNPAPSVVGPSAVGPAPEVASPTPTRLVVSEPALPTTTPEAVLLPSPTPTFQICSPLGWETLPELAEIVGDPYKPPPPERAEERHHGVDFSHWSRKGHPSIEGEPVQAVLPGIIAASIANRLPYGNMLIIETSQERLPAALVTALDLQPGQSLYLLYAHMQQPPTLKLGDEVVCGQVLGPVGAVGYNVVNAHLHLETRRGPAEVRFESMAFYTTDATLEEMANYQRWRTGGEFVHFDPFKLLNAVLP